MERGAIYKNIRHHPSRTFMVRKVKKINGSVKSIRGDEVNAAGQIEDVTYPLSDFQKAFPFVMWIPPACASS